MDRKETALIASIGGSIGIITVAFILAVYFGAVSVLLGEARIASDYGAFVTGIATIGLVIITGVYTYLTRKQSRIMEDQLEQERKFFTRQREQDWTETTRSILARMEHLLTTNKVDKMDTDRFSQFQTNFDALVGELNQQLRRKPRTLNEHDDEDVNSLIRAFIEEWYKVRSYRENVDQDALLNQIDDLHEAVDDIMKGIELPQQDDDTASGPGRSQSTNEELADKAL